MDCCWLSAHAVEISVRLVRELQWTWSFGLQLVPPSRQIVADKDSVSGSLDHERGGVAMSW